MRSEVEGVGALVGKMRRTAARVDREMQSAIGVVAEETLATLTPGVPMAAGPEGGNLRESGYVDKSRLRQGIADIGFDSPYAVYVHEYGITVYSERAPIDWTTPGTGARFLTGPFNALRRRNAGRILGAARRALHD